jgi:hypothetical protein
MAVTEPERDPSATGHHLRAPSKFRKLKDWIFIIGIASQSEVDHGNERNRTAK